MIKPRPRRKVTSRQSDRRVESQSSSRITDMRTLFEKIPSFDRFWIEASSRKRPSKNQEVQRFANALREMGRGLRESREKRAAPRGCMVRSCGRCGNRGPERTPAVSLRWLRPALATGLVLAGGLGVFMLASRPASDRLGANRWQRRLHLGSPLNMGTK